MRILLLGHGRMGQLVESLASSYDATIAGVIDESSGDRAIAAGTFGDVDVAIDFTLADAVPKNLPQLAARKINVVIGTTGWGAHEAAMRTVAEQAGIGVLAAANFSLGMNIFQLAVEKASRNFAQHAEFGFDGPSETIEFTHTVRDRAVFARGALVAAKWLVGKKGWFSIRDLLAERINDRESS
jgi:4-hydroxy-tetrahydrodipicolinate reductase